MRRHCLSRSTWRQLRGGRNGSLCPSRYASIRALGELTLVGSSAHYGIRLFGPKALPSPPPCSVCSIAALLLSCLLPLLAPMRVVERIVDLSRNPQVVQKHRELPRHCNRRSLLGVLAPARSYLLSVAP